MGSYLHRQSSQKGEITLAISQIPSGDTDSLLHPTLKDLWALLHLDLDVWIHSMLLHAPILAKLQLSLFSHSHPWSLCVSSAQGACPFPSPGHTWSCCSILAKNPMDLGYPESSITLVISLNSFPCPELHSSIELWKSSHTYCTWELRLCLPAWPHCSAPWNHCTLSMWLHRLWKPRESGPNGRMGCVPVVPQCTTHHVFMSSV